MVELCRRAECRFASVAGPGIWSAWLWESPAIGLRAARGSIAMNETTPTASSRGASPRVETYPPVERAASLPVDAPPPVGPLREESWRSAPSSVDGVISDTLSGSDDPDWLEPHPRGAHGHSQLQGSDVAAWAAASTVGFRSTGALRRASTGNVEASLASHRPDGSGGLDEADPWGSQLETDHGFGSWAWAARAAVGSPARGAPENAPAGDAEANLGYDT